MCFSTPPRIFRQVASLVGLQLVTSLINVAKMLGAQRETTQRQLNAERKKHVDGPRVESLNKRLSTTHEKITVIDTMMRKIFTGYEILPVSLFVSPSDIFFKEVVRLSQVRFFAMFSAFFIVKSF